MGKSVSKAIRKQYLAQRSRGSDGFGFYLPEFDRLTHNPREGRALSLLRRSRKATEILWHHRFPTSTANIRNACHPFSTKDYFEHNYVGVHNGVLWNESDLKKEHNKLGIKYVSEQEDGRFNDSEALMYDVARYIEGQVDSISAQGSIAMITIQREKSGKPKAVYFGRNSGNPLVMKLTDKVFSLSSEGDGVLIDPDTMYCFSYETGVVTRSPCRFPTSRGYSYGEYRGYNRGYNWDSSGMDDDLQRWDNTCGFDAYGNIINTRTYFDDEKIMDRSFTKNEKERLLYDASYNTEDAIVLGDNEVEVLNKRIDDLRDKVEIFETATDSEIDDYYSSDSKLYYIKLALVELRREAAGEAQMGFRISHSPQKALPGPKE